MCIPYLNCHPYLFFTLFRSALLNSISARQEPEGEDASLSSTKDNLSSGYTDDTADIDVLKDAESNEKYS